MVTFDQWSNALCGTRGAGTCRCRVTACLCAALCAGPRAPLPPTCLPIPPSSYRCLPPAPRPPATSHLPPASAQLLRLPPASCSFLLLPVIPVPPGASCPPRSLSCVHRCLPACLCAFVPRRYCSLIPRLLLSHLQLSPLQLSPLQRLLCQQLRSTAPLQRLVPLPQVNEVTPCTKSTNR